MNIKIKFISLLADYTGEVESILKIDEESSVKDLIEKLIIKYGEKFVSNFLTSQNELNKYILLILNDKDLRTLNGLDTLIMDGDEITFLPVIAGG
ncbi:MAG: MoaD/ThiS family protein [Promethearchaeota archaeon]|nr:MAG: MoaD/ThiS family protein [Candidatus Lokiarchaeota archaeon]